MAEKPTEPVTPTPSKPLKSWAVTEAAPKALPVILENTEGWDDVIKNITDTPSTLSAKELEAAKQQLNNRWQELKEARWEKSPEELFRDWPSPLVRRPWSNILSNPEELSQNERASDLVLKNKEKSFVQSLSVKHNADIKNALTGKELKDIDSWAREKVYSASIRSSLVYESIPDLKEKQDKMRSKLENEEFKKLPPSEQENKIKEQIIADQTRGLVWAVKEFKNLSPEDQKKPENRKKLLDASRLVLWLWDEGSEKFIDALPSDAATKDQIIKNIQEKGMMEGGIDMNSPTGLILTSLARNDYDTYIAEMSENASLDDLPMNIRQNLLLSKGFLRPDQDVPPKLSRDIQVWKNQFQNREWEKDEIRDARIDETLQGAGIDRESFEKSLPLNMDRSKMSPILLFFADLLAPLGATMWWKTGEFWRKYMQENGSNPNNPPDTPMADISTGVEGWKIDAQYSKDHEENVQNYLKENWSDPAYQNKISSTAQSIESYKGKYQAVSTALAAKWKIIPWEVIGAIHEREGSLNFNTCLHNGDPLNKVTTHVPKWLGPFGSWENAAIDALSRERYIEGMETNSVAGLARIAEFSERYNWLGYRKKNRVSPYVWSGASFYTGWRYVADGKFSATSKDSRPGVMPVVMQLAKMNPEFKEFKPVTEAELSSDPAVKWFQENSDKAYGSGEGKYDCMTSTHAALWLDYTQTHSTKFNGKYIDSKDSTNNLWNVSMASALYSGNIATANSEAENGIIARQSNGYYGEKSSDIWNMEYYIEENVMKRVADAPGSMIDVWGNGKLIHYSKKNKWIPGIVEDIKKHLKPWESAMMWGTGNGTNQGWHEWLITNTDWNLLVYDATGYGWQGVSKSGTDLSKYLEHSRRSEYKDEAIIFAKK